MIIVGIIIACFGCIIYNAALTTIKNQIIHTGKRELKLVFILILGLGVVAVGGVFVGIGLKAI